MEKIREFLNWLDNHGYYICEDDYSFDGESEILVPGKVDIPYLLYRYEKDHGV